MNNLFTVGSSTIASNLTLIGINSKIGSELFFSLYGSGGNHDELIHYLAIWFTGMIYEIRGVKFIYTTLS